MHVYTACPLALNMAGILPVFTPLWQSEKSLPKERSRQTQALSHGRSAPWAQSTGPA